MATMKDVARRAGVPIHGLWLDAPVTVLEDRLRKRVGDASDADVAVLHKQLAAPRGTMAWHALDATRAPDAILNAAQAVLDARDG